MKTYKFTDATNTVVHIIDADGVSRSSCSVEHPDYLAWLAEGNTPEPADPVIVPVPTSITMRQARVYLHRAGSLDAVTSAVNAAGGEAAITWEFSSVVERSNPLVASIAAMLGWTSAQLDTMFQEASAL